MEEPLFCYKIHRVIHKTSDNWKFKMSQKKRRIFWGQSQSKCLVRHCKGFGFWRWVNVGLWWYLRRIQTWSDRESVIHWTSWLGVWAEDPMTEVRALGKIRAAGWKVFHYPSQENCDLRAIRHLPSLKNKLLGQILVFRFQSIMEKGKEELLGQDAGACVHLHPVRESPKQQQPCSYKSELV